MLSPSTTLGADDESTAVGALLPIVESETVTQVEVLSLSSPSLTAKLILTLVSAETFAAVNVGLATVVELKLPALADDTLH
jgi:hypothetical protein